MPSFSSSIYNFEFSLKNFDDDVTVNSATDHITYLAAVLEVLEQPSWVAVPSLALVAATVVVVAVGRKLMQSKTGVKRESTMHGFVIVQELYTMVIHKNWARCRLLLWHYD